MKHDGRKIGCSRELPAFRAEHCDTSLFIMCYKLTESRVGRVFVEPVEEHPDLTVDE
jgi:hypothetical protein